jgi:hypothetical protein
MGNEFLKLKKQVLVLARHIAFSEKLRDMDEQSTGVRRGFEATPERCELFTRLTDNLFEVRNILKEESEDE